MEPGLEQRFELLSVAGQGGMGKVYRARDRRTGAPAAVKVLTSAEDDGRFAREAELLAQLEHPRIVRYLDHGQTERGEPWLAMEWLEGCDLAALLATRRLSRDEALRVVRHTADALAFAHTQGIVHRDVKPHNVFLVGGEVDGVRLLDFGIARPRADLVAPLTRTGMLLGTPAYMAPEQARGLKDLDARVDVFALGCVLFECLTGRPPFLAETPMAVLARILLEEAPRLSEVAPELGPELEPLLSQLLAKRREARPASAQEVVRALDAPLTPGPEPRPGQLFGRREQRLVCVVAGGRAELQGTEDTLVAGRARETASALRTVAASFGAAAEALDDGSFFCVFSGQGAATDLAAQAARCALQLRARSPASAMALVTGRAVVEDRLPLGEALDRAVALLGTAHPGGAVRLDALSTDLLGARFELSTDSGGALLQGERVAASAEPLRPLLGRRTPFVGRDRELGSLQAAFRECAEEQVARAVLVTGPAGQGKSRLRHELQAWLAAREEAPVVWTAAADVMRAGSPLFLAASALKAAFDVREGASTSARQGNLARGLARHLPPDDLPRVGTFLAELLEVEWPQGDAALLRAARADAVLMGDQMRRAWEDLLHAVTSSRPLVLVLEDLHWGDAPTVRWVDAALRHLRDRPLLVVAFARPEVATRFPHLWADRGVQELRLSELTPRAAERLVRGVLGDAAADGVVKAVVKRASGNAFYLEELIRAVASGRGDALPETVLAMAQARLESLEPEARHLLRAASVFGESFWEAGVATLARAERVRERLQELVDREVLVERNASRFRGQREYAFRHAYLRDAAFAMLMPADRAAGHLAAATWLEEAGETDARSLARHYEAAGAKERAVHWLRVAAEQSLVGSDLPGTIEAVDMALALGAEGDVRAALLLARLEAWRWVGEHRAIAREAEADLAALPEGSEAWLRVLGNTALALGTSGNVAETVLLGRRFLAAPRRPEATRTWLMAGARLATQRYILRSLEHDHALADDVEAVAAATPREDWLDGWLGEMRAFRALIDQAFDRAADWFTFGEQAFTRSGDLRNACALQANLVFLLNNVGLYPEALELSQQLELQATRLGAGRLVSIAHINRSLALTRLGRLDESAEAMQRPLRELTVHKDPRHAPMVHAYQAFLLLEQGRLDEALQAAESARADSPESLSRFVPPPTLARVLLRLGRPAEALALLEYAPDVSITLTDSELGRGVWLLLKAEAHLALGRPDEARAALAEAVDEAARMRNAVRDPRYRQAMLGAVPTWRRARELAAALLPDRVRELEP